MLAQKKAQKAKMDSQNLRTAPPSSERDQSTRRQFPKSRKFDEPKPKPLPRLKTPKKPVEGMQLLKRKNKPQQGKSGGYLA